MRKPVLQVSCNVWHKLGCTALKTDRGLKFGILEEEGLYYLSSENKGVDQLHDNLAADLHHAKSRFSHDKALFIYIASMFIQK